MPMALRICFSFSFISIPQPTAAPMMCSLLLPKKSGVLPYFIMDFVIMLSSTRESRRATSWPTHSAASSSLPVEPRSSATARMAGITMGGTWGTGSISRPFHSSALQKAATAAEDFPPTPIRLAAPLLPCRRANIIPILPLSEAMPPSAFPRPSSSTRLDSWITSAGILS